MGMSERGGIKVDILARNLPKGTRLHQEFGIMDYSDLGTLRSKFCSPKFKGLNRRTLQIVSAASVGAYYQYERGPSDVRADANVVSSKPK